LACHLSWDGHLLLGKVLNFDHSFFILQFLWYWQSPGDPLISYFSHNKSADLSQIKAM
jgi:hypothetical protein